MRMRAIWWRSGAASTPGYSESIFSLSLFLRAVYLAATPVWYRPSGGNASASRGDHPRGVAGGDPRIVDGAAESTSLSARPRLQPAARIPPRQRAGRRRGVPAGGTDRGKLAGRGLQRRNQPRRISARFHRYARPVLERPTPVPGRGPGRSAPEGLDGSFRRG